MLAIAVGINSNDLFLRGDKEDYAVVCAETYLLVTVVFVVVYLFDETKKIFEILFMFSGCVLLTIAGIIILIICFKRDQVPMAFVLFCFFVLGSGIILIVDFTFMMLNK